MLNDRPPDNPVGSMGTMGSDLPKAAIGNYKGVMLCNRPNEFGQARKAERTGALPFNSRVNPPEPVGWNPTQKLQAKGNRKKCKCIKILKFKF